MAFLFFHSRESGEAVYGITLREAMAVFRKLHISLIHFFVVFLVVSFKAETVKLPPNISIPALLVFGDSIVDTGNNNNRITEARCNFPPYGRDFKGGKPTGRFGNGKVPSDIIGTCSLPTGRLFVIIDFY